MKTSLFLIPLALFATLFFLSGETQFVGAQSDERAYEREMKEDFAKAKKEEKAKKKKKKKKKDGACCDGPCEDAQTSTIFNAGNPDGFVTTDGPELTSPRSDLQTYMNIYPINPPNREFDDQNSNRVFGHTFANLPEEIICATLEIGLKARPDIPSNDRLHLNLGNGAPFAWTIKLTDIPEANGTWENNQTAVVTLDLADLIESPSNGATEVISSMNVDNLLDVYFQDDTAVDYMILTVVTLDGVWTSWLNRDNPKNVGDYETVSDFINEGDLPQNPDPICIQCRTLDGVDWQDAGQNYHCDLPLGGRCINAENGGNCLDYEVRFLYPQ